VQSLQKQGRLQVSDTGETVPWLCPSHPDNLVLEKNALRELVRNNPVDGIHLDYIRYQNVHLCYCKGCRSRYEASVGVKTRVWPNDVTRGALIRSYRQWRCAQITRLVRDVSALARQIDPRIQISAAVYGKYPSCVDSVGQDWAEWMRAGYVDFVCPMNYTEDTRKFDELVRAQLDLPSANGKIFPGIGVTATESQLDSAQVIDQVNALRKAGAKGFALFDLNRTLESDILPVLRSGLTAEVLSLDANARQ
jgi:uncharacterized lipoprotein YddW (UPF0748 family)